MPRALQPGCAGRLVPAPPSLGGSTLAAADLRAVLDTLHAIGEGIRDQTQFGLRGVEWLPRLVSAELTTLSVCNLDTAHRAVVTDRPGAISRREIEAFDRHFDAHPLVREHARNPGAVTRRIDDLVGTAVFERSALYQEYYRLVGVDRVMAVPILVDRHVLVSYVLNRKGRGFSDRDRAVLEIMRPQLGDLYRLSGIAGGAGHALSPVLGALDNAAQSGIPALTPRERDVVQWLAAGKSDRDIAAILAISVRTVHKHLQNVYTKLGVESRSAALMRLVTPGGRARG